MWPGPSLSSSEREAFDMLKRLSSNHEDWAVRFGNLGAEDVFENKNNFEAFQALVTGVPCGLCRRLRWHVKR